VRSGAGRGLFRSLPPLPQAPRRTVTESGPVAAVGNVTDTLLGTDVATRATLSFARTATDSLLDTDTATKTQAFARTAT